MLINKKAKIERVLKDSEQDNPALVVYAGGENGVLPLFDSEFGRVTAVGSHMMVSVPCTIEAGDVEGPIPGESLTYARQHTDMPAAAASAHLMLEDRRLVTDNGTVFLRGTAAADAQAENNGFLALGMKDGVLEFRQIPKRSGGDAPADGPAPLPDKTGSPLRDDGTFKAGPTLDMLRGRLVDQQEVATVRLNPTLLKVLADAMGSATVKLTIYEDSVMIRVDCGDECELQGAFGYLAGMRRED